MARKTTTRAANLPVPQSREEAASHVRRIGEANREVARIELKLADDVAGLKEAAEALALPLKEESKALTEGLKLWAEANRDAITGGGKVKTADLGTGKISWRLRPAMRSSIRTPTRSSASRKRRRSYEPRTAEEGLRRGRPREVGREHGGMIPAPTATTRAADRVEIVV